MDNTQMFAINIEFLELPIDKFKKLVENYVVVIWKE